MGCRALTKPSQRREIRGSTCNTDSKPRRGTLGSTSSAFSLGALGVMNTRTPESESQLQGSLLSSCLSYISLFLQHTDTGVRLGFVTASILKTKQGLVCAAWSGHEGCLSNPGLVVPALQVHLPYFSFVSEDQGN